MPKGKKLGINIEHDTARSQVHLVPIMSRPINYAPGHESVCPNCRVVHPVKTIHLWFDGDGKTTISPGVLNELKKGNGLDGITVVGDTKTPPPLNIGRGSSRPEQDQQNRKLQVKPYKEAV